MRRVTQNILFRLTGRPHRRQQVAVVLEKAREANLIDGELTMMMTNVMQLNDKKAREIMVPINNMIAVKQGEYCAEVAQAVVRFGYSRFPVLNEEEEIIGILLVKELLNCKPTDQIDRVIRPVMFIPESKRLHILLKEFRMTQNHLAIVIDEYGQQVGLVSIEDVIEEVVGNIEDEFDTAEESNVKQQSITQYTVKGTTPLAEFNQYFKTSFDEKAFDTVAGLMMHHFGYLPKRQESIQIDCYRFTILQADARRIHLVSLEIIGVSAHRNE